MHAATLDDYLALVDYGTLGKRRNGRVVAAMRRVANSVPRHAAAFYGFERPLARRSHRADFAFSLTRAGLGWAARRWPELGGLWRRRSNGERQPAAVWLEFDTSSNPACADTPSVFVAGNRASAGAIAAGRWPPALRHALKLCVEASPTERLQIGSMAGPRGEAARLCALWLDAREVRPFLKAVGWPGDLRTIAAVVEAYAGLCDAFAVHLDVSECIAPQLGIELFYGGLAAERQPDREPRWSKLLRRLVDDRLCFESERRALLGWASQRRIEAPLVERLIAATVPSEPPPLHGTLRRGLAHVKLSFDRMGKARAKAYYGAVFEAA